MTKELESSTELKAALITSGTRLALLSESGSDSGRELEDSDSELSSIQSRLRQTEQDWSSLLLDLPAVQHQLHKVSESVCVCVSVCTVSSRFLFLQC